MTNKPTLLDVLCGLEQGDRIEYSNRFGQTFQATVERIVDAETIMIQRPEWQALGFGSELLKADQYRLEKVLGEHSWMCNCQECVPNITTTIETLNR